MNNVNIYQFYEDNYVSLQDYNKLQKRWDNLREYIGKEWYCFDNESVEFEVAKNILDKMNELESGENSRRIFNK